MIRSVGKLLEAIKNYWKLINYEVDQPLYSWSVSSKNVRTEWDADALLLPITQQPIRGIQGTSVNKIDKVKSKVYLLLEKALKPLENWELQYKSEEVISAKKLIDSYLDELMVELDQLPNLNARFFESLGYKHFEPDELPNVLSRMESSHKRIVTIIALEKIFSKELQRVGYSGESEIQLHVIQDFLTNVVSRLTEIANREYNHYKVTIFLNSPLIDKKEDISLGETDFDGIKIEPYIGYANDEILSEFTSLDPNAEVSYINTVCSFDLQIKVGAEVYAYLYIYELAGKVAERLVDSLRLICNQDIGVLGLEVIPQISFAPSIRKTLENRYQKELAPIFPKRFHYQLSSFEPINDEEISNLVTIFSQDWNENLVKGIDIAIKRFRSSVEKYIPDDPEKLLDLAIALEAIYLNDGDNKELTYRLSLRASRLLAESFDERYEIFKVIRDLYKYRSKVAHGETLDSLKRSDAERLSKVLETVPKILSLSIIKMLLGHGPNGLKDPDRIAEWWSRLELQ